MTDEDSVTITRKQWEVIWKNADVWDDLAESKDPFAALKAHVKKKERRECYLSPVDFEWAQKECDLGDSKPVGVSFYPHGEDIPTLVHVREVFEGDILKTKEEAREWVGNAYREARREYSSVTCFPLATLWKALGLGESGED